MCLSFSVCWYSILSFQYFRSRRETVERHCIYVMASRASGEEESIVPLICCSQPTSRSIRRRMKKLKFRGIGSRYLLLLLAWIFLIKFSLNTQVLRKPLDQVVDHAANKSHQLIGVYSLSVLSLASIVSIPAASLLAEVVLGRYKMVKYCLKAIWLFSIGNCIISLIAYSTQLVESKVNTIQLYLTQLPSLCIFGAFLVSAMPLGIDQLIYGSGANISAFLLWEVWVTYCGLITPYITANVISRSLS